MAKERIDHKEKKDSTLLWFIIGIIPIADLYLLWKVSELISGHEKLVKNYEFLNHKRAKGSTTLWFVLFLLPTIIGLIVSASVAYTVSQMPFYYGTPAPYVALILFLLFVEIPIGLYLLWKTAEVVSGHEKVYKKYEALVHKDKKGSTLLWFIIGIIPIVDLYLLWKVAEAVSGHEKIYK